MSKQWIDPEFTCPTEIKPILHILVTVVIQIHRYRDSFDLLQLRHSMLLIRNATHRQWIVHNNLTIRIKHDITRLLTPNEKLETLILFLRIPACTTTWQRLGRKTIHFIIQNLNTTIPIGMQNHSIMNISILLGNFKWIKNCTSYRSCAILLRNNFDRLVYDKRVIKVQIESVKMTCR